MIYVRKENVERMAMQESDFLALEMYMQNLYKEMKGFKKKSKQIAKMADALAKDLETDKSKKQAMKLKDETKELFGDIAGILGNDTPSPRFSLKRSSSYKKSPSKSPKKAKSI